MTAISHAPVTLEVEAAGQAVSAALTQPVTPALGPPVLLLLGHGVTNDREHPLLRGYVEGLALHGVTSLRFNFPFKERGDPSPDAKDVLLATLDAALAWAEAAGGPGARILLGGKSLGARLAAAHQARHGRAHGMVYLGFPLHRPDAKDRPRGDDLLAIPVPQYCAQGDQDPFCDLALFAPVHGAIQTPWHLEIVAGGDHGLGVEPGADPAWVAAVLDRLVSTTRVWLDAHLR